jgi:hypothetical protein
MMHWASSLCGFLGCAWSAAKICSNYVTFCVFLIVWFDLFFVQPLFCLFLFGLQVQPHLFLFGILSATRLCQLIMWLVGLLVYNCICLAMHGHDWQMIHKRKYDSYWLILTHGVMWLTIFGNGLSYLLFGM